MKISKETFNFINNDYASNSLVRSFSIFCLILFLLFLGATASFASISAPSCTERRADDYAFMGIDVSEWQGNINWQNVKADGVDYAFVRAGATTSSSFTLKKDLKFETNMTSSHEAGVARGVYWYSQATTEEEAVSEAKRLVELAKEYDVELPLVMDLEFSGGRFDSAYAAWRAKGSAYAKAKMTSIAEAFLSYCHSQGYGAALYLSTSLANGFSGVNTDSLTNNNYEIWVAHYSSKLSANCDYRVWQFSSTEKVNGIRGNVDADVMYVDKQAEKAGHQGISAEVDYEMVKYTGSFTKPSVTITDNGKKLNLYKDFTVTYLNNINNGEAYALIKGIGEYLGYTELLKYQIGDEEIKNSKDLEPSDVVTSTKNGKLNVRFTAAASIVDDYRIEYRNSRNDEWKSVKTGGKVEYSLDINPKYIRVSAVLNNDYYGIAVPNNSQKYEIINQSVVSDSKLDNNGGLPEDRLKNINKEVSEDVVL